MKNIIDYYYGLNLENEIYTNNNIDYYFYYGNLLYCISKIDINITKRIVGLYNNYNVSSEFHNIILNKKGNFFSINNQDCFILMKINCSNSLTDSDKIVNYYLKLKNRGFMFNMIKNDWASLWRRKVDYLEYYTEQNQNIDGNIRCLCNYFIGMSENAISLINYTVNNYKNNIEYERVTFCHDRIKKGYTTYELYNPKNILIDHYSRDVSEYLKSLLFYDNYEEELYKIVDRINFSQVGYLFLLARTMFPTFFFDILNDIDDTSFDDKALIRMYDYVNKYETLISKLYWSISKKVRLPKIKWLD